MPHSRILDPSALSATVQSLLAELEAERSDRATALVAAEWLSLALGTLVNQKLLNDLGDVRVLLDRLDALKPRTRLAFSLGLIGPKMRHDLVVMAEMRNEFAHRYEALRFEDEAMRGLCDSIQTGQGLFRILKDKGLAEPVARERFVIAAVLLAQQLALRALRVERVTPGRDFAEPQQLAFDIGE